MIISSSQSDLLDTVNKSQGITQTPIQKPSSSISYHPTTIPHNPPITASTPPSPPPDISRAQSSSRQEPTP